MKKISVILMVCFALAACSKAYYSTMEKFGIHKRDLMVDRISEARDSQQQAKEQFEDALQQFSSIVNYDGGDLKSVYENLNAEYDASVASAEKVSERIDSVESVAKALFAEWEDELDRYENNNLRKQSEAQLNKTHTQYDRLIKSMRQVEDKMPPVLEVFEDQVLFLKHNLNAKAVAALESEYQTISTEVEVLLKQMQTSINQANEFIEAIEQ